MARYPASRPRRMTSAETEKTTTATEFLTKDARAYPEATYPAAPVWGHVPLASSPAARTTRSQRNARGRSFRWKRFAPMIWTTTATEASMKDAPASPDLCGPALRAPASAHRGTKPASPEPGVFVHSINWHQRRSVIRSTTTVMAFGMKAVPVFQGISSSAKNRKMPVPRITVSAWKHLIGLPASQSQEPMTLFVAKNQKMPGSPPPTWKKILFLSRQRTQRATPLPTLSPPGHRMHKEAKGEPLHKSLSSKKKEQDARQGTRQLPGVSGGSSYLWPFSGETSAERQTSRRREKWRRQMSSGLNPYLLVPPRPNRRAHNTFQCRFPPQTKRLENLPEPG